MSILICWGEHDTDTAALPYRLDVAAVIGDVQDVSVGPNVCVAHADGRIACWGTATATGLIGEGLDTPTLVEGDIDESIAVGANASCELTRDGEVSCWADDTGWGKAQAA